MGSSSSCGWVSSSRFFLSGEATSNTLLPTLSWKFARGSAGSGLGEGGLLSIARVGLMAKLLVGLVLSSVFLREGGVHVFRVLGARAGGSISCLLFLLAKGLLKKFLLFCTEFSSIGLGSANDDCGIGLPGEQEPLGGSTLEKELGFEQSLWESLLAGRTGLGIELRSDGAPMRQNWVIPSAG
jgi:hypothetical protein